MPESQEWGGITTVEVPQDVYEDFLEHYLILNSCRRLFAQCHRGSLPPSLGMAPYNDVIKWATDNLDSQARQIFLEYVEELAPCFSRTRCAGLPRPSRLETKVASQAEDLATHLLNDGTCPLWSAARQVALLLQRERPRHTCTASTDGSEGESFTFGAYSKGPFSGFCRLTLTHPNSARLFNAYLAHLRPTHRWASVAVLFNCLLPPHIDHGNSREPNLVTSLSLHEAGEIWIECPGGEVFQEHAGKFVPGHNFSIQLQVVTFPAHRFLHCTCAWTAFDRRAIGRVHFREMGLPPRPAHS